MIPLLERQKLFSSTLILLTLSQLLKLLSLISQTCCAQLRNVPCLELPAVPTHDGVGRHVFEPVSPNKFWKRNGLSCSIAMRADTLSCSGVRSLQLKLRYVIESQMILTAPTTKGPANTRTVPNHPQLAPKLAAWRPVVNPDNDPDQWVFPGRNPGEHLTRRGFDNAAQSSQVGGTGGCLNSHVPPFSFDCF